MKKLVIFGFSANPPGNHHLLIARKLVETFDKVVIVPCGIRLDKPSTASASPLHRKEMVRLAFSEIINLEIDYYDLDNNTFTPTWMIDQKYKAKFPNLEIWHAAGGDLIKDGSEGRSEIQKRWQKGLEIWTNLNWAVIDHLDCPINIQDLPPKNILMKMEQISGRSTTIRNKVAADQPISDLVPLEIESYIKDHNLYK